MRLFDWLTKDKIKKGMRLDTSWLMHWAEEHGCQIVRGKCRNIDTPATRPSDLVVLLRDGEELDLPRWDLVKG